MSIFILALISAKCVKLLLLWPLKSVGSLALLLQLIEHLPLPLCVCDRKGETLGGNSLWREQQTLAELPPPIPLTGAWSQWQLLIGHQGSGVDRLKSDFLSCINHELKTPLTSVIGMASLLNQQTLGELNQRQSRYVQMIHQSGRHLMEIINMIVDLAQMESGQLMLEPEPVEIKSVCEASMRQTQRWLEQEAWLKKLPVPPIDLRLEIRPDLQFCTADVARLQQMLANLLSNACKFSHHPDREVLPAVVHLQVEQWGRWITFTVIDRGIGIPDAQQHLIFQKFQQVDNSLVREYGGTGLGLVLTRQLARLHGGDVTFISQVGAGSKFTILLPIDPSAPVSPLPERLVLLGATDTREILRLSDLLEGMGYQVVTARNGLESIDKIRLLQPFASLLQPDLPLLAGEDILTLLKHDRPDLVISVKLVEKNIPDHQLVRVLSRPSPRKPLLLYRSQFLRDSLREALQCLGYRLLECADLAQAELLARLWRPDLIITSIPWGKDLHPIPTLIVDETFNREMLDRRIQERISLNGCDPASSIYT